MTNPSVPDISAHPLECTLRGPEIARAVIQNNQLLCHRVPLVDGTPATRGSGSTA